MINIIDSFRNVAADKYAFIKIFILSIPVLACIFSASSGNAVFYNVLNLSIGILFAAIFFETIRRSCASEPMLLPSFLMPARMFVTLGLTLVASIPVTIICAGISYGYYYVLMVYFPDIIKTPITFKVCNTIFGLLISSLYMSSVTQFLDSGKIVNSYNPIKVLTAWKTFIVNTLFFSIQDVLFIIIIMVLPGYIVYMLAGMKLTNFFVILWVTMFSVMNYLMWADFYAQTKKESELY